MEQKKGVPKRIKFKPKSGQTKSFAIKGTLLWVFFVLLFFINAIFNEYIKSNITNSFINLIADLVSLIIIILIFALPVIIIFSVLIKLMEKGVDKIFKK